LRERANKRNARAVTGAKGRNNMQFFKRFALALVTVSAMLLAAAPQRSDAAVFVGVGVNIGIAPPALPVYVQPAAPFQNAIWQPGYWAWAQSGYYWVPGVWVAAARPGYLWTPGYWGFGGGYYRWHPGYWATHVGFYGGINYGFGYFGTGFVGGGWFGGVFRYNTAVVNVNTTVIHNTYVDRTVVNNYNTNVTRVSYNGGAGGVRAFPTADERAVAAGSHLTMTSEQRANAHYARVNQSQSQYRPQAQSHYQPQRNQESGQRPAPHPHETGRPRPPGVLPGL
jgi:hypothetical protein